MIIRKKRIEPKDFDGLKIFDYTAGRDTKSSFATIIVSPGSEHVTSWSKRSDKYYYVISGRIMFTLEDERFELLPGDSCLVAKGQRFSYKNPFPETAEIILVHTPSFDLESEVFIV